jgi:hypothetical protein
MSCPEDIRAQILTLVKEYHTAKFMGNGVGPS